MEKKVNYRVQLKLLLTNETEQWEQLLLMISKWINQRHPTETTRNAIQLGILNGDLTYSRDNVDVIVRSILENSNDIPQFYSVKFVHMQTDGPMAGWRHWITDIGIERIETGRFHFHMTNSYQTRNGYIGKPDEPFINSPNIIKQIIGTKEFGCQVGNQPIKFEPIELTHDNVNNFINLIFNTDRILPIVLISLTDQNSHLLAPDVLNTKVVGNALVYYESEHSISQYIKSKSYFDNYRCSNGTVRIYVPGANYSNPNDFRRHRFYTPKQIFEETPSEIIKIIAESLVRRSAFIRPFNIQSIDSVEQIFIEDKLKTAIQNNKSDEIINSYKAQVEHVRKEIIDKEYELLQYCNLYDEKESEATLYKSEVKLLERKVYDLELLNDQLSKKDDVSTTNSILELVPTNLHDLLVLLSKYYTKNLVILEEAYASSKAYELRGDINKAWSLLRSIPEILSPILFDDEGGDKRDDYISKSGFDLSMTESKKTKGDKKLLNLRARIYKGRDIEINAHVGYGVKKPFLLRVYFYVSAEDRKIIIGHCGDHLDTFSTRNLN